MHADNRSSAGCANDNRPPRSRGERLRDITISVLVILLIAGATGSFNIQTAAGLS